MLSLRKADELAGELQKRLFAFPMETLAQSSGFVQRKARKVSATHFVLGFFLMALSSAKSLKSFATTLGLLADCTITKQGVDQRLKAPFLKFLELLLAASLAQQLKHAGKVLAAHASNFFHRILIQDSTCIQLPSKLAKYFPGSRNAKNKKIALLKIQMTFDVVREQFVHFFLSPFTRNDQRAALDIFSILRAGDLILRDLGYFVLSVFQRIQLEGGYFLSRLKYGVKLYEPDGVTPFDLLEHLKREGQLDRKLCVGANEKFLTRVVAIPVAEAVAAERRRKYRANRDRRLKASSEHLALLGWNIFITNVPTAYLPPTQIAELYGLRWRAEIIFKSWKSHFQITHVPEANVVRATSYLYAMLIFITLFQTYVFARLYQENLAKNNTQLSLLKVTQFFKEQLWAVVLFFQEADKLEEQIFQHCIYEARKDRQNYAQKALPLT